jgi:ribonucleoside-diphosphate reductase alpha chain
MMGTLCDTHPDLPAFITAKQTPGRLTNFNVSILVSDAFMEAVRENEDWMLYFQVPPYHRDPELEQYDFYDEEAGCKQYVYSIWKAQDLWKMITEATYEFSEPGVIFIDRVNDLNNLHYCEEIRCTNPCGEQPLPPHGTCNLGSVNLSRMVLNPFTPEATFNWNLLKEVVAIGVRFLDNVIDVTGYPLPQQEEEEKNKRRLGLGITGLADALAQMCIRYGSAQAGDFAELVMKTIAEQAYESSIDLAMERGPFPLFSEELLAPNTFAGQRLHPTTQDKIRQYGLRNGLLLTNAPTGTTSVAFGDVSSSLEPVFAYRVKRRVRQSRDDEWKEYISEGYCARLWKSLRGNEEFPSYMVETKDLKVEEHIFMQARIQKWVDASVSKTVNCPEDMSYESFVRVYDLAYSWGCKGCTTYRPSKVRGSILAAANDKTDTPDLKPTERPKALPGMTYKINWPQRKSALYLTINRFADEPWEIFITSKDARDSEWTTALTLMITANLRKGGENAFIAEELQQIHSVYGGAWVQGKYYGSLPAYIGHLLEEHFNNGSAPAESIEATPIKGEVCPECLAPALIKQEGCDKCVNCGYSKC